MEAEPLFEARVRVRFSDVDNAGIVYYPRLLHFCHLAFEDFFGEYLGRPYHEVLGRERVAFPAVHVEVDFARPFRFGDVARIVVRIERVGGRSVDFAYELVRDDEAEPAARARITIATVSMDTLRAIDIPPGYRAAFEAYRERCAALTPPPAPVPGGR